MNLPDFLSELGLAGQPPLVVAITVTLGVGALVTLLSIPVHLVRGRRRARVAREAPVDRCDGCHATVPHGHTHVALMRNVERRNGGALIVLNTREVARLCHTCAARVDTPTGRRRAIPAPRATDETPEPAA